MECRNGKWFLSLRKGPHAPRRKKLELNSTPIPPVGGPGINVRVFLASTSKFLSMQTRSPKVVTTPNHPKHSLEPSLFSPSACVPEKGGTIPSLLPNRFASLSHLMDEPSTSSHTLHAPNSNVDSIPTLAQTLEPSRKKGTHGPHVASQVGPRPHTSSKNGMGQKTLCQSLLAPSLGLTSPFSSCNNLYMAS